MKKVFIVAALVFLLSGCSSNNILKKIEINNASCEVIEQKDTHGGFLSDGDYFAMIKCFDLSTNDLSDNWKKLPLSDELNIVKQMEQCDDKDCKTFTEKYNIPDITNGYYLFIDRYEGAKNKYDCTEVNSRSSYNFSLAMYDIDNSIIYYYELDT